MMLKLLGGNKNERIQTSKLERSKECFETLTGMQSTKARKHFGQINRINLPRKLHLVGVELHLLVTNQVGRREALPSFTSTVRLNSCLNNYKEETI